MANSKYAKIREALFGNSTSNTPQLYKNQKQTNKAKSKYAKASKNVLYKNQKQINKANSKYSKASKAIFDDSTSNTSQLDKNQKQINNALLRLEAGGVDVDKATDNRNLFEKLTNLPQDQNVILDLFELLGRPQQALFNGISNVQTGDGSFLEGLKSGISGEKETGFKQLLKNASGMELGDTTYEDLVRQGEKPGLKTMLKSIDLVDIAGLVGDVALDPMDIPFIPISTGAKGVDTLADGAKVVSKLDDVADGAKVVSKLDDVADTAKLAKKSIEFVSPTDALGRAGKSAIKKGINISDTAIEKVLTKVDNMKGIQYADTSAKWANELGKMGADKGLLETYKGLKNNVYTMFDTTLSKMARKSEKTNKAVENILHRYMIDNYDNVNKTIAEASERLGKSVDEVSRDLNKIIDVNKTIKMSSVIENASEGTIKYTDELHRALIQLASDVPDDTAKLIEGISKGKNGVLELSEDWSKVYKEGLLSPDLLNSSIERGSFYTKSQLAEIDKLTKFYQENAPEAVKSIQDFYDNANRSVEEAFSSMKGFSEKYADNVAQGFSKHKVNSDYNNQLKELVKYGADPEAVQQQILMNSTGVGAGNRTLSSRKYQMSAGEANILKKRELMQLPGLSKEGKEFVKNNVELFDDLATSGIQQYINDIPRLAKNSQVIDEVFMKQGFGDIKQMTELKDAISKGVDVEKNSAKLSKLLDNTPFRLLDNGKAPYGFKKLDESTKQYLVNFLNSTGNKSGSAELKELAEQISKLDDIAIDPTVLSILRVNTNTTQNSEFLNLYDKLLNEFKRNKTASITNQMNNIFGNTTNLYLSGMSVPDIAKYSTKSLDDLTKYEKILNKGAVARFGENVVDGAGNIVELTADELEVFNRLDNFQKTVTLLDDASILKKYDIDTVIKDSKKLGSHLEEYRNFFGKLNAQEDRIFKYAAYLKALDDPKYTRKLGIEALTEMGQKKSVYEMAGEAVNKILFDPSDLTSFEQTTMKRLVPFYTFSKKNLAFQLDNMGNNLGRYNKMMKTMNSLNRSALGDDYDNVKDYIKENMYIPILGKDDNGNYSYMRAQLPFGDVIDLFSDPMGSVINKSTPFIKTPFELVGNKNFFNGQEIEKYPGQKGNIGILDDIPFLNTAKGQQLLSNLTGYDVPAKQLDRIVSGFREGDGLLDGFGNAIGNLTTMSGNVDSDRINKSYEEIDNLKNLMKQYEQQGYTFSTMTELKKANKNNPVSKIQALFNKYGIDSGK